MITDYAEENLINKNLFIELRKKNCIEVNTWTGLVKDDQSQ